MTFPMFESMRGKIRCSQCGARSSGCISKRTGEEIWHKNKVKGHGFWCKVCYNRHWRLTKK